MDEGEGVSMPQGGEGVGEGVGCWGVAVEAPTPLGVAVMEGERVALGQGLALLPPT